MAAMPDSPPYLGPLRDGFTFNLSPWGLAAPFRYYAACLQNMEVLRRANLYKPRWAVFPDDINEPIPAYETVDYEFSITAGSYLWGYSFFQFNENLEPVSPSGMLVQIVEACSGIELTQDYVLGNGYSGFQSVSDPRGRPNPQILTSPRLILEPGKVTMSLSNKLDEDTNCQLMLFFAEPMLMLGEV